MNLPNKLTVLRVILVPFFVVFLLLSKTTETMKWIALVLLPALGTLYFGLAQIWGFPYGEQIVGTITVVDTFLGVILGISNAQYKIVNPEE